jgi:predicted ATPase/DNA-binding SARP family transcriptional activator
MLGPLEVRGRDGAAVEVPGARLRSLLIVLALDPGRLVPMARLVDGIWGRNPPAGAVNAVQALVSRLRRTLSEVDVESHPTGYLLAIEPGAVDVVRFERLVAAGRSALGADDAAAVRSLREALGLWRGEALLDVSGAEFLAQTVTRLSELRLSALEDRVEAELRLGRLGRLGDAGGGLSAELTSLVAEHPLRERLVGASMRALCAAGRPAEALIVYERTRRALAETLGADPSPGLSALHTAVLRGEVTTPSPGADGRPRTNLRAALTSFVGREEDLAQVARLVGEHRLTTLTGPGGSGKTRLAGEAARTMLELAAKGDTGEGDTGEGERAHTGADKMADGMADGVWLVELAPVVAGADVPQAVLAALGVREQALPGEPIARLVAALRTRNALLILDNCEHLIDAAAALADRLLGECPRLRILATSREPLGINGETIWPVEPLGLPPEDADAAAATSYPAVRLLSDRARAARPGFAVTDGTAPAVVRICRALDGMPLAIELAAARLRTMTTGQLAGQLDERFRLLTGGSRIALPRHQTLRAVVDWSWDLLTEEERVLLRRLAIFAGGVTVEAAEKVCADAAVPAERVLDLLGSLTDKSLLIAPDEATPRHRMLETLKAYGLERLDEAGERDRIRRAHAACFTELAETADPHLRRAGQLAWLATLAADGDNVSAALRGAIAAGDAEAAVRLVAAAGWYWYLDWALSGRKAEGADLAAAALAMPGTVGEVVEVVEGGEGGEGGGAGEGEVSEGSDGGEGEGGEEVRATASVLSALFELNGNGDERRAERWILTARRLAEGTGRRHPVLRLAGTSDLVADEDPWVRAMARMRQATTLVDAGHRHAEAEAGLGAALAEFRAIGERLGISASLTALADLAAWRGDLGAAIASYEQAVVAVTEVVRVEDAWQMRLRLAQLRWLFGDVAGSEAAVAEAERDSERIGLLDAVASVAYVRAEIARWTGELRTARTLLTRAEALSHHITVNWQARAMVLDSMAYLDAGEGDLEAARAHRADALTWALRSRSAPAVGQTLVGVADLALHGGRPDEAARLLAASVAVRGTPDLSHPDAARIAAATRAALTEPELAEATRRGRTATIATARDIAAPTLGLR